MPHSGTPRSADSGHILTLYGAARAGNVNRAAALIATDPSCVHTATAWDGATPLHVAAEHGCLHVVRLLLLHGAQVLARNNDGHTALGLAAALGYADIVRALVTFRPPVPVGVVVVGISRQTNNVLWEEESVFRSDSTMRHTATESVALPLLSGGGALSALCIAAFYQRTAMLRLLVDLGASVHAPGSSSNTRLTPLHIAAQRGDVGTVEALLALGAAVTARDAVGCTAVHHAAAAGHAHLLPRLVHACAYAVPASGAGVSNDAPNRPAAAASVLAVHTSPSVVSCVSSSGKTALMEAASHGHAVCVQHLLALARPGDDGQQQTDDLGWSALDYASAGGHAGCVELLLLLGCAELEEHAMVRAALLAVAEGHIAVAMTLLKFSSRSVKQQVLRAACTAPRGKALPTLAALGDADCHPLRCHTWSPLLTAARHNNALAVHDLAALGVDVTQRQPIIAAMHVAAAAGHVATITALVELGAAVNEPDAQGTMPILLAHRRGHADAVACLAAALLHQAGSDAVPRS